MEAEPAQADDPVAVNFPAIAGDLFVQQRQAGGERVLLRHDGVHLRVDLTAGTVLDGPIRPRVVLPGLWGISPQLLTLKRLGMLARHGRLPASLQPREKRASRWARMLQAHDGAAAGATHREIANTIFGADVVRAEWRGISRALARGGHAGMTTGIAPQNRNMNRRNKVPPSQAVAMSPGTGPPRMTLNGLPAGADEGPPPI